MLKRSHVILSSAISSMWRSALAGKGLTGIAATERKDAVDEDLVEDLVEYFSRLLSDAWEPLQLAHATNMCVDMSESGSTELRALAHFHPRLGAIANLWKTLGDVEDCMQLRCKYMLVLCEEGCDVLRETSPVTLGSQTPSETTQRLIVSLRCTSKFIRAAITDISAVESRYSKDQVMWMDFWAKLITNAEKIGASNGTVQRSSEADWNKLSFTLATKAGGWGLATLKAKASHLGVTFDEPTRRDILIDKVVAADITKRRGEEDALVEAWKTMVAETMETTFGSVRADEDTSCNAAASADETGIKYAPQQQPGSLVPLERSEVAVSIQIALARATLHSLTHTPSDAGVEHLQVKVPKNKGIHACKGLYCDVQHHEGIKLYLRGHVSVATAVPTQHPACSVGVLHNTTSGEGCDDNVDVKLIVAPNGASADIAPGWRVRVLPVDSTIQPTLVPIEEPEPEIEMGSMKIKLTSTCLVPNQQILRGAIPNRAAASS